MDKWEVRKAETADVLIAAMRAGICKTNADVEIIAADMGDTVKWYKERKEREDESPSVF